MWDQITYLFSNFIVYRCLDSWVDFELSLWLSISIWNNCVNTFAVDAVTRQYTFSFGTWIWTFFCVQWLQMLLISSWCHGNETLFALLDLCEENPSVTDGSPSHGHVMDFWNCLCYSFELAIKQTVELPVILMSLLRTHPSQQLSVIPYHRLHKFRSLDLDEVSTMGKPVRMLQPRVVIRLPFIQCSTTRVAFHSVIIVWFDRKTSLLLVYYLIGTSGYPSNKWYRPSWHIRY